MRTSSPPLPYMKSWRRSGATGYRRCASAASSGCVAAGTHGLVVSRGPETSAYVAEIAEHGSRRSCRRRTRSSRGVAVDEVGAGDERISLGAFDCPRFAATVSAGDECRR